MKVTWTFFRYELRRYLPAVLALWVLIPLLPWLDRGTVESWIADGDAREAAAVVMLQVVAPLLALGLALWSWLGEKISGVARFVYARPVSGDLRFATRLAAVWTAVAVYVAGVSSFLWVNPLQAFEGFVEVGSPVVEPSNPWWDVPWDLPAGSSFVLLWLVVAAGTLISVAVTRPSRAVGSLALGAVGFVGLLHVAWWASRASGWLQFWNAQWIAGAYLLFVFFCGVALLLAAWRGARRAPLGPLPWQRMATVAAIPLAVAFLGVAPLNLSPLDVGSPKILEEVPWGEAGTLDIVQTPATHEEVAFAIVQRSGDKTEIRRPIDLRRYETPGSELAVFFDPSDPVGWFAVDERGEVHDLQFPWPVEEVRQRSRQLLPVSLSGRAEGFAWTETRGGTLWWMGRDRVVRQTSLPPEAGGGLWLDENEIYLFVPRRRGWVFRTDTASLEPMDWKTMGQRLREGSE